MKDSDKSPWDKPLPPVAPRLAGGEPEPRPPTDGQLFPGKIPPPKAATHGPRRTESPRRSGRSSRKLLISVASVVAVVGLGAALLLLRPASELNVKNAALSIVLISAQECGWTGSGSLVTDDGLILTNSHVATNNGVDNCGLRVAFTDNYEVEPDDWYSAEVIVDDVSLDLAVIQLLDESGAPTSGPNRAPIPLDTSTPSLGDEIQTLGYPGAGGFTMTFTSGDFAGIDSFGGEQFYKTTASMNPGVSGGAAFATSFALVGVPSAASTVDVNCDEGDCRAFGTSIGFIRPIRYAEPLIERAREIMDNRRG